jgi:hypothetical protein
MLNRWLKINEMIVEEYGSFPKFRGYFPGGDWVIQLAWFVSKKVV